MRLSRTALSSFGTLALVVLSVAPAGARERFGGKHLPPRGSEQRTVTRTGVNGQSHTWTQNSTWQRGNGAWSRDTTTTNPQGKTWNTQVTGAKTADGFVRDKTVTGPNGGVTTRDASGSYDPATHTFTRDVTVTHPDGKTSSVVDTRIFSPAPMPTTTPAPAPASDAAPGN